MSEACVVVCIVRVTLVFVQSFSPLFDLSFLFPLFLSLSAAPPFSAPLTLLRLHFGDEDEILIGVGLG